MTDTTGTARLEALIRSALSDPDYSFSIGTFGAVAEFHRDPAEPFQLLSGAHGFGMVTARGGIRIALPDDAQGVAYLETTGRAPRYGATFAVCLAANRAALSGSSAITDLGPDLSAIRETDREHQLFDMGVGMGHIRTCVRTSDRELINMLTAHIGKSVLEPGSPAMLAIVASSPHRVFISQVGRIEVFQGIPQPGTSTPIGPHTHVLPRLIAANRAFSANAPIPAGLLPVLNLHPPAPYSGEGDVNPPVFNAARASQIDLLVAAWGLADEVALAIETERDLLESAADAAPQRADARRRRQLLRAVARRACARGTIPPDGWMDEMDVEDDEGDG